MATNQASGAHSAQPDLSVGNLPLAHDHNLLSGRLLTASTLSEVEKFDLPGLIARLLTTNDLKTFPQLPAEQRGHYWRFLVRTAAKALRVAQLSVSEASSGPTGEAEAAVRQALLQVTELGDWSLFQPDVARPGFLQAPLEAGVSLAANYRNEDCSLLTAIIGTKGHERKIGVTRELSPEETVYSLIEYQTGAIYGGAGNYGSQLAGSQSGAGSGTPFMGGTVANSLSLTFNHDVTVFLKRWIQVVNELGLRGDIWALWRESWNGVNQLLSTRLDPAFIPLARMIRLGAPKAGRYSELWFRPSKAARVLDHTGGGRLGDTFTPTIIDPTKGHRKVRGTLEKGYDYREVFNLLFGEEGAQRSPSVDELLSSPPADGALSVVFEGLALGQGKTLGFHRREVQLPRRAVRRGLALTQARADKVHGMMLNFTQDAKRVLRSSFGVLWKGSPKLRESYAAKLDAVASTLELLVDQIYVDTLLSATASDEPIQDAVLDYRKWLFDVITTEVFPNAVHSVPRSAAREMEALTRAEAYLRGGLREVLDLPRIPKESEEAS